MTKALFLLKRRGDYTGNEEYSDSYQMATGMWNSAVFVADALVDAGREAAVEMVVDANSIDAVVTQHNPDFVFIEGIWVLPSKMAELLAIPRHQSRTWVIRIHSEIPFLATEGIAMERIADYLRLGVAVAPNAPRAHQQLSWFALQVGITEELLPISVPYLPNMFPTNYQPLDGLDTTASPVLKAAAFGAMRPMKNHLQQMFVAGRFAQELGKSLEVHINTRVDQGGQPVIKNVREMVAEIGATLVEHPWEDRATFLQSIANCDLLLQVSMSETFNIVAADATLVGRPILVSSEISWAHPLYADPQNVDTSLQALRLIWANKPYFIQRNRIGLTRYVDTSNRVWLRYVA